jgi:hypothetical protein
MNLKKKSGQVAVKMKYRNFEKEFSLIVLYLFEEETHHSSISSPSSLAHDEFDMD